MTLSEDLGLAPMWLQLSLTPLLGDLMPSSNLRYQALTWNTYVQVDKNIHTHKDKKKKPLKFPYAFCTIQELYVVSDLFYFLELDEMV